MANDLIRIRRDIYTNWTAANPVLALGEISYDLTNDEIRVGDGTTAWLSLPAVGSANLSDGSKGDIVVSSGGTVWSLSSALVAEIAAKLEASDLNLGTSTTPATTPLQIRRGNTLSWTGVVLQAGEIGFDSQLNEIRIGDGITDWDNLDPVGLNKLQNLSLEQIGDVVIANLTPGDVLIHDGTNWINQQIQFPATDLDDLTSVTLGSPTLGQVLTFNGTVWINSTPSVLSAGVKNDINVVSDTNWQIVDDSVTQAKLNLDLPVNPWDAATKDYTDTTVGLGIVSIEDQFGQPNGPALLDSTRKIGTGFLATGTASSTTFLRGDRTWATVDSGIPVGVKNDITVVAADDWQITANSIETAMLKLNSVNASKIGGTGITAFGKLLLGIATPGDQQVPLYDDNEGAWIPTSISDLIGPVALDTVVGIKDVSGGLLGISNQGLVDPSFLSSGYESISRQVLGNTSWIPEDLYKNPTTDTVAYTDGRSLGTWSLSALTSGSVIFDNTAIISALAETANSNAAIKLPTTITANDKSLEFTARVRVRGASITPNTNYVVGLYEMSTGVERYAAVVARDNVSTWTTVAKPDSGASGTSTSTAISCLAWTDVKITIKNNEIKMYINNTLVSTTATTAFVGLPLSLGCAVFCEAATSPQAELEVEYMRVSNTDGQLIHPRMIEQAGATTGQVLSWSGSTWQPAAGGVGGATNLDGLSDVTVTSPATSQTLKYNGTSWVNNKLNLADILELDNPINGQILGVISGAWTPASLNTIALTAKLDPIGITPSTGAGRILLTSKLDALGDAVDQVVYGNFLDTATIDATFEDRSTGSAPTTIAKWKFDVKDSSIGTTKLGGDITTAGKALLDDADAAAQRTTLGLGTAATSNTTAFAAASHTHAGEDITSGTIAAARLGSGTADSTTFLRGDNTWQTVSGGATNLDSLSDVTVATPTTGQTLQYNGTVWANSDINLTDITDLQSPTNGQILAVSSGAWTATTLNNVAAVTKLDPIGITPSATAGRILLTSLLDGSGASVQEIVHGNFIDTTTIDATFEDRSTGTPSGVAKWKFDVKDSSIGTTKLGGDITTAGKALLDDTDAAAQRTTLGLGTAATSNTSAFAAASHTHAAGDITTGTIATARLGSGTADSTTFLRGDNTWQTVSGGGATNLDGLSDVVITTPASNNLLGYNGSSWVNRAVNDAIGDGTLGVGKLSQGTATNGQVLAWNNIASSWAPADPSGGGATPQGSDGAIQYNSAGSFEGATSTLISANGNIQLNDSTESTGIANSTILFSKSFAGRSLPTIRSGSACPDTNLQVCLGRNRIAWANFSGASTTLSAFGIALATTGTAAAGSLTVSGGTQLARQMRTTYSNTAAINAFAGIRTGSSQVWRGTVTNSGGFHIVYRFGRSDAITLCSEYHGVSSTTSAPGAAQVDPVAGSSYANKFGIGIRTTDTNYQLMHCNGNAVATVVDTGIAAVQNVSYRLELFWEPGNSSVMKWLLVREDNDTSATGSASTNLPAQNTALGFTSHRCTAGNTAVVTHNFISYYHEQIGLQ